MIAWIEARIWQVGTIGASAAAIGLGIALLVSGARLKDAEAARDKLQASITAPGTGWAARLTTCQNNVVTLGSAIQTQNDAIKRTGEESAARLAAASAALKAAQRDNARAEAKVAALMKPLVGVNTCQRVIEADERLLESLK